MSKKPLRSQARNIVYNVYRKIKEEEGVNQTQSFILKRVVELTGISSTTIRRIVTEGTSNDGVFSTPGKKRRGGKKKINLDSFDLQFIRNKVNEFYTVRKEIPTVNKLLQILRQDIDFNGGRETLRFQESKLQSETNENEKISDLLKCKSKLQRKRARIYKLKNNLKTACFVAKTVASAKEDKSKSLNKCLSSVRSECVDLMRKSKKDDNINNNLTRDNEKLLNKLKSVASFINLGYRELQKIRQEPSEETSVLFQLRKLIMCCGEYYADYYNEHEKYLQINHRCQFLESKMSILENYIEAMTEQMKSLKYSKDRLQKENALLKNRLSDNLFNNNVQVAYSRIKINTGAKIENATIDDLTERESVDSERKKLDLDQSLDLTSHLLTVKKLLNDQDTLLKDLNFITREFSTV